ncbi:hypothetical protein AB0G32_08025 [Streptomyces sp. NPDC023723]|uniref:hypothetical protein n=1 Tax=Streptomyces sp. NPDC023723 TaxID=3154323 RepID=UPI0033DD874A
MVSLSDGYIGAMESAAFGGSDGRGPSAATMIIEAFEVITAVLASLRALFNEGARAVKAWKSFRRAWD